MAGFYDPITGVYTEVDEQTGAPLQYAPVEPGMYSGGTPSTPAPAPYTTPAPAPVPDYTVNAGNEQAVGTYGTAPATPAPVPVADPMRGPTTLPASQYETAPPPTYAPTADYSGVSNSLEQATRGLASAGLLPSQTRQDVADWYAHQNYGKVPGMPGYRTPGGPGLTTIDPAVAARDAVTAAVDELRNADFSGPGASGVTGQYLQGMAADMRKLPGQLRAMPGVVADAARNPEVQHAVADAIIGMVGPGPILGGVRYGTGGLADDAGRALRGATDEAARILSERASPETPANLPPPAQPGTPRRTGVAYEANPPESSAGAFTREPGRISQDLSVYGDEAAAIAAEQAAFERSRPPEAAATVPETFRPAPPENLPAPGPPGRPTPAAQEAAITRETPLPPGTPRRAGAYDATPPPVEPSAAPSPNGRAGAAPGPAAPNHFIQRQTNGRYVVTETGSGRIVSPEFTDYSQAASALRNVAAGAPPVASTPTGGGGALGTSPGGAPVTPPAATQSVVPRGGRTPSARPARWEVLDTGGTGRSATAIPGVTPRATGMTAQTANLIERRMMPELRQRVTPALAAVGVLGASALGAANRGAEFVGGALEGANPHLPAPPNQLTPQQYQYFGTRTGRPGQRNRVEPPPMTAYPTTLPAPPPEADPAAEAAAADAVAMRERLASDYGVREMMRREQAAQPYVGWSTLPDGRRVQTMQRAPRNITTDPFGGAGDIVEGLRAGFEAGPTPEVQAALEADLPVGTINPVGVGAGVTDTLQTRGLEGVAQDIATAVGTMNPRNMIPGLGGTTIYDSWDDMGGGPVPSTTPSDGANLAGMTSNDLGTRAAGGNTTGIMGGDAGGGVTVLSDTATGTPIGIRYPDGSDEWYGTGVSREAFEAAVAAAGGDPTKVRWPSGAAETTGGGATGTVPVVDAAGNTTFVQPGAGGAAATPSGGGSTGSPGGGGGNGNYGGGGNYGNYSGGGRGYGGTGGRGVDIGAMFGGEAEGEFDIEDFLEDFDRDGKITGRDRMEAKKRMRLAMRRRKGAKTRTPFAGISTDSLFDLEGLDIPTRSGNGAGKRPVLPGKSKKKGR